MGTIPAKDFRDVLQALGYAPKDWDALIDAIDAGNARKVIAVNKLLGFLNQCNKTKEFGRMYGDLDTQVKAKIDKINQFIQLNNITLNNLHEYLDKDKNGQVDRMEFVSGLEEMNVPGLLKRDFITIFEKIDIDGNGFLSVNEFSLFL